MKFLHYAFDKLLAKFDVESLGTAVTPDPLAELLAGISADGVPDFAWVVEHAPDGNLRAAAQRVWATSDAPRTMLRVAARYAKPRAVVTALARSLWPHLGALSTPYPAALQAVQTWGAGYRIRPSQLRVPRSLPPPWGDLSSKQLKSAVDLATSVTSMMSNAKHRDDYAMVLAGESLARRERYEVTRGTSLAQARKTSADALRGAIRAPTWRELTALEKP
jgi:hypothetical protein